MKEEKKKLLSIRIRTAGNKPKWIGKKHNKSTQENLEHNLRLEEMDDNYLLNPELSHENILEGDLDQALLKVEKRKVGIREEYQKKYLRKMPSNWKPTVDVLMTFGETMQDDIYKYGIAKLNDACKAFCISEFGEENIIASAFHMDETTPHMHITLMNWSAKNQKVYSAQMEKEILDSGDKSNPLQDRFADYLQANIEGFDYQRGLKKANIKDYHNERHAQDAHIKAQKVKMAEVESELAQTKSKLGEALSSLSFANDKLKQLQDFIASAEVEKQAIINEHLADIQSIIDDLDKAAQATKADDFYNLIMRYIKSDDVRRVGKLVNKWKKKQAAAKKLREDQAQRRAAQGTTTKGLSK